MSKWYQNHSAVVEAFVDAPMDERGGKASNLFFENGTLYSYGYHFPLAVPLKRNDYEFFVVNGDNYSSSTATHRNKVFGAISQEKYAVIPLTALDSMFEAEYSRSYTRSYSYNSRHCTAIIMNNTEIIMNKIIRMSFKTYVSPVLIYRCSTKFTLTGLPNMLCFSKFDVPLIIIKYRYRIFAIRIFGTI